MIRLCFVCFSFICNHLIIIHCNLSSTILQGFLFIMTDEVATKGAFELIRNHILIFFSDTLYFTCLTFEMNRVSFARIYSIEHLFRSDLYSYKKNVLKCNEQKSKFCLIQIAVKLEGDWINIAGLKCGNFYD